MTQSVATAVRVASKPGMVSVPRPTTAPTRQDVLADHLTGQTLTEPLATASTAGHACCPPLWSPGPPVPIGLLGQVMPTGATSGVGNLLGELTERDEPSNLVEEVGVRDPLPADRRRMEEPSNEAIGSQTQGDPPQPAPTPAPNPPVPGLPASDGHDDMQAAFQEGLRAGGTSMLPYRGRLEEAFGTDLGDVRVHQGSAASAALDRLGAAGAAVGKDILLPPTPDLSLVAHEVAHVVQARSGTDEVERTGSGQLPPDAEQEADDVARAVASGERVLVQARARQEVHLSPDEGDDVDRLELSAFVFGSAQVVLRDPSVAEPLTDPEVLDITTTAGVEVTGFGSGTFSLSLHREGEHVHLSGTGLVQLGQPVVLAPLKIMSAIFATTISNDSPTQATGTAAVRLGEVLEGTAVGVYTFGGSGGGGGFAGAATLRQIGALGGDVVHLEQASVAATVVGTDLAAGTLGATVVIVGLAEGSIAGTLMRGGDGYAFAGLAQVDQTSAVELSDLTIQDGSFSAIFTESQLLVATGRASLRLGEIAAGEVQGSLAPAGGGYAVSGSGTLTQTGGIGSDPVVLTGGQISASVVENSLASATIRGELSVADLAEGSAQLELSRGGTAYVVCGHAVLRQASPIGEAPLSVTDGVVTLNIDQSVLSDVSVSGQLAIEGLGEGTIAATYDAQPKLLDGTFAAHQTADIVVGLVKIYNGELSGSVKSNVVKEVSASASIQVEDIGGGFFGGRVALDGGAHNISGQALIHQEHDIDLAGFARAYGGNLLVEVMDSKVTKGSISGNIDVVEIGTGTVSGELDLTGKPQLDGFATVHLDDDPDVGAVAKVSDATLSIQVVKNELHRGTGSAHLEVPKLNAVGEASVEYDFQTKSFDAFGWLASSEPIVVDEAQITALKLGIEIRQNHIAKVGIDASVRVEQAGSGSISGVYDVEAETVTGKANVTLEEVIDVGPLLIDSGTVDVVIVESKLQGASGCLHVTIGDEIVGNLDVEKFDYKSADVTVSGSGTVSLKSPKAVTPNLVLSEGSATATVANNKVMAIEGEVHVDVAGYGEGTASGRWEASTAVFDGSANVTQGDKISEGPVTIQNCTLGLEIAKNKAEKATFAGSIEIDKIGSGTVANGLYLIADKKFSGSVTISTVKPQKVGIVEVQSGSLSGTMTDNVVTEACGEVQIRLPSIGKGMEGSISAHYVSEGGGSKIWGKGEVDFRPHEKVEGTLTIDVPEHGDVTGSGQVIVKLSDRLTATVEAQVEPGGEVRAEGALEFDNSYVLFDEKSVGKDFPIIPELEFPIWGAKLPWPVSKSVGVLAGIRLNAHVKAGVKAVTLSNLKASGSVDLGKADLGGVSFSGKLTAGAFAEAGAALDMYVKASLGVVEVEGGAHATAVARVDAGIAVEPKLTVGSDGIAFETKVDVDGDATLNLAINFYCAVRAAVFGEIWRKDFGGWSYAVSLGKLGATGNLVVDGDSVTTDLQAEMEGPTSAGSDLKGKIGG